MTERISVSLMLTQKELHRVKDALGERTWPANRLRIEAAFERKAAPRKHVRHFCRGVTLKGTQCKKGARFRLGGLWYCSLHRIDAARKLGLLG